MTTINNYFYVQAAPKWGVIGGDDGVTRGDQAPEPRDRGRARALSPHHVRDVPSTHAHLPEGEDDA